MSCAWETTLRAARDNSSSLANVRPGVSIGGERPPTIYCTTLAVWRLSPGRRPVVVAGSITQDKGRLACRQCACERNCNRMVIDFHTHVFPPEVIARRALYAERDDWFAEL